jgi:diazepam-binding inhibitor (GABA receptor modulating acyl-CoA-binding protein)
MRGRAVNPEAQKRGIHAMDNLKELFEQAVADRKSLSERPNNATLLKLYSLYKQATEGDVHGNLPDVNDFVGCAK